MITNCEKVLSTLFTIQCSCFITKLLYWNHVLRPVSILVSVDDNPPYLYLNIITKTLNGSSIVTPEIIHGFYGGYNELKVSDHIVDIHVL